MSRHLHQICNERGTHLSTGNRRTWLAAAAALCCVLSGCATAPRAGRTSLEIIQLNGRRYVALDALCSARGLQREYDPATHRLVLSRKANGAASPVVAMAVGEKTVLVNDVPRSLRQPVELHENSFLLPVKFAEELQTLFGEAVCSLARTANTFSRVHTIVIDAGHGGKDPGAISRSGLREKDITLDVAKRLRSILEAQGAKVILSRDRDRFIPLERRAGIADDAAADLFVSVHVNANKRRSVTGFEVYHIASRVSDTQRAALSQRKSRLRIDGSFAGQPSKPLQTALWDMLHTFNRSEAKSLSRTICARAECDLQTSSADVKSANFAVLRETTMPAVLVEVGYISNAAEERLLRREDYRQSLAESLAAGIAAYAAERT